MPAINNKNNFQNEVMNSDKPVLLGFCAPRCSPRRMDVRVVEGAARKCGGIKVGKMDVDAQPGLARQIGVMGIPTLAAMKDGKIVNQGMGARPKSAILEIL